MQKMLVENNSLAARIHRREVVATRIATMLQETQARERRLQQHNDLQGARITRILAGAQALREELKRAQAATTDAEHHLIESVETRKRLEGTLLGKLREKVDNNERDHCLLSEATARKGILILENGHLHSELWLYQRATAATAALAVLLFGTLVTIALT